MVVETAIDRAVFIDDFGLSITGSANFKAIFDHEYIESLDITGEKPVLTAVYDSNVSDLSYGDLLTVDSVSYAVVRVEPDGTGMAMIILEEQ